MAPGIAHGLVPEGVEAEWVSDGGEVHLEMTSAPFDAGHSQATLTIARDITRQVEAGAIALREVARAISLR